MKLLLLVRSSGALAPWRDRLAALAGAGWSVRVVAEQWEAGPLDPNLVAAVRHDPDWALEALPLAPARLPRLAARALRRGGRLGSLAYLSFSAVPAVWTALERMAPDVVMLASEPKAVAAWAPVLATARAQGFPCALLHGWGPLPAEARPGLFSDALVPDAAAVQAPPGVAVHGLGPRLPPAPDATAARTRLLRQAGLDPESPYGLYLCGRASDRAVAETLGDLAQAVPGLQWALLPDAQAKVPAVEAATGAASVRWAPMGRREGRNETAAVRRFYAALAGGARIVAGEATPLLLDAAAAGLPAVALPTAGAFVAEAGQTQRFGRRRAERETDLASAADAELPQAAPIGGLPAILGDLARRRREPDGLAAAAGRLGRAFAKPSPPLAPAPTVAPEVNRSVERGQAMNLDDEDLAARLAPLAAGSGPVLVGPWVSEVGFEVLYWIPFVRWCVERFQIDPARLVVCSRGGVSGWYGDLGIADYLDIFDLMDEEAFREATLARFADAGGQKHVDLGPLDDRVFAAVRERHPDGALSWLHPQLMYRFFRPYWLGEAGHAHLDRHLLPAPFVPDPQPNLDGLLPDDFVAVRFYFRSSFPDTPEVRAFASATIARLAERRPVVLMDTGLKLDDHEEFAPEIGGNIHRIGHLVTGRNNLALQTDVMRRARAFVGTYGGLSYIPPFCGVPSLAISQNAEALRANHLESAIRIYQRMDASFSHVDTRQAETLLGL